MISVIRCLHSTVRNGLCSVLRPLQHSIGYMADGFLQVTRPNQQYQSTDGKSTKEQSKQ